MAKNGLLEITASGTTRYCTRMHQVCSLLRREGKVLVKSVISGENKVRLKHAWNRCTVRKAWTINTGSKACKKACKLFAVQEQFLRGNASKMRGPLYWGLIFWHTGSMLLGWSLPWDFLPASQDSSRWKPSGTVAVSMALRKPCITVIPAGFNQLLILKFSFLALRARLSQRDHVGRFPSGVLDGLTQTILLLKNREDGRGRQALTHTKHKGN